MNFIETFEDQFDSIQEMNKAIVEGFVKRVDEDLYYRRTQLPHWEPREKIIVEVSKMQV